MKKNCLVIVIVLCTLFTGCQNRTYSDYLRQPKENIEEIELLRFIDNEHVTIYTLEKKQFDGFVEEVCALNVSNIRGYPTDNCGLLVVRIYYSNGDIEMFGNEAIKYTTMKGDIYIDDWHSVLYADLYNLFTKYVDVSGLPVPN